MLTSFIVPVYKPDCATLHKAIKSLLSQSYKEWEAIIVLDGEDHAASAVLSEFKDKRITILNIEHAGVQRARNTGATAAKGDILWFWDCDCIIEPDTCKTFIDQFKQNPDIDFIYSGYKFIGENGGIPSEEFDPWTLKCGNYISTCFPMRSRVFPGWDESLESLQDWDLWLTITEKGGKGLYLPGYAFSTLLPSSNSISGRGCTNKAWLGRVNVVKNKHSIPNRKICVTSISYKHEGIRLAKLIDADYKDFPNSKPNEYETVIQIGFGLNPRAVKLHASIFAQKLSKKVIFWTAENISEINNGISLKALTEYSEQLNKQAIQYVEDLRAKHIMERAGFNVSILPLPMVNTDTISKLPKEIKVLADITEDYRQLLTCLQHSMPDVKFDTITSSRPIKDYNVIFTLNSENTLSFNVKRMLLAGRSVVSNIKSPFCGYINDSQELGDYVSEIVNTIRKKAHEPRDAATKYWADILMPERLMGGLK